MLRGTAGEKCKIYLSTPNGECPLTPSFIPCGIVELSHTPPLCFAVQNIGEVARSAGGVRCGKGCLGNGERFYIDDSLTIHSLR